MPEELLREGFRQAVLQFLAKEWAISEELRSRILEWRHCGGFSVHNRVRVAGNDPEGRQKLAGYMLRAPLSLAKMFARRRAWLGGLCRIAARLLNKAYAEACAEAMANSGADDGAYLIPSKEVAAN